MFFNHMSNPSARNPYVIFGVIALALVVALTVAVNLHLPLPQSALIATNVVVIFLVGLDKSLSKGGSLRVPEVLLYVCALFGGAVGLFVGTQVFRHKTRKASFYFVLLSIFAFQVFMWRLYTSPSIGD
jgi:uncharacterized membrane protein YsdA (DUF1294 family)